MADWTVWIRTYHTVNELTVVRFSQFPQTLVRQVCRLKETLSVRLSTDLNTVRCTRPNLTNWGQMNRSSYLGCGLDGLEARSDLLHIYRDLRLSRHLDELWRVISHLVQLRLVLPQTYQHRLYNATMKVLETVVKVRTK